MTSRLSLVCCLLVLSSLAQANDLTKVSAAHAAKLAELKKQAHPLGSIVQTIVSEAKFRNANGPGWVEMKGQDILDSRLCKELKVCTLPNAEGTFLRTKGPKNQTLAQRDEAKLPDHTHVLNESGGAAITFFGNSGTGFTDVWMVDGGPVTAFNKNGSNAGGSNGAGIYSGSSARLVGTTAGMTSSQDVKPLNLTVQTLIRID